MREYNDSKGIGSKLLGVIAYIVGGLSVLLSPLAFIIIASNARYLSDDSFYRMTENELKLFIISCPILAIALVVFAKFAIDRIKPDELMDKYGWTKFHVLGSIAVVAFLVWVSGDHPPSKLGLEFYPLTKVMVIDGDTIKINGHRFRFIGIDTAEMGTPGGMESKNRLLEILREGNRISIDRNGLDVYGRTLANVDVWNGDDHICDVVDRLRSEGHHSTHRE